VEKTAVDAVAAKKSSHRSIQWNKFRATIWWLFSLPSKKFIPPKRFRFTGE
jgi:hypothetical protein